MNDGRQKYRWHGMNSPYAYRNDNLRQLGFGSYRAYLKSPLWADIRARVLALKRKGGRCEGCQKRQAVQVHHRAYDPATLRGERLDALTATCAGCHRHAERPERVQQPYDRLQNANSSLQKLGKKAGLRRAREATFAPLWW